VDLADIFCLLLIISEIAKFLLVYERLSNMCSTLPDVSF